MHHCLHNLARCTYFGAHSLSCGCHRPGEINANDWSWITIKIASNYHDLNRDLTLQWRHNECDGVSNHQPHDCLLCRLFGRRSKKTSKLRVTGLCAGKSPGPVNSPHKGPVTGKMFPFDDVIMNSQIISITRGGLLLQPCYYSIYIWSKYQSKHGRHWRDLGPVSI